MTESSTARTPCLNSSLRSRAIAKNGSIASLSERLEMKSIAQLLFRFRLSATSLSNFMLDASSQSPSPEQSMAARDARSNRGRNSMDLVLCVMNRSPCRAFAVVSVSVSVVSDSAISL